jgi:branched-chain amino acid transport system substrate-binding protein
MLKKIKIGLLVPGSGIYRTMGLDFENGLLLAVGEENSNRIEVTKEFIGQGNTSQVQTALQKLESFQNVDLFTGILTSKVASELQDFINKRAKPFLVNNLGEQTILPGQFDSSYVFINDFGLCQSEYAFGRWFTRQGAKKVSIAFSIYEGGYHLHQAFRMGTISEGMHDILFHQLPLIPEQVDASHIIEALKEHHASYVHAIFCGIDGQDFLTRLRNDKALTLSQFTASPFLIEEGLKHEEELLNEGTPSATTWSASLDSKENREFVSSYIDCFQGVPNAFSLLGYETGLSLKKAIEQLDIVNPANLQAFFTCESFKGPRGTFSLTTDLAKDSPAIYLQKLKKQKDGSLKNCIVDRLEPIKKNNLDLISIAEESLASWQNPYLCI